MELLEIIGILASILFGGGLMTYILTICFKAGTYSERMTTIEKGIEDIKTNCSKIWDKLSAHGEDIVGLKVHTAYGASNSPVSPNERGRQLLVNSGFNATYPNLKDELFGIMDSLNLRTLYDYEKGAIKALKGLQDNPHMDALKEYAVNHPNESLELIFKVASWIIRDDYKNYKDSLSN